jgi:predicted CxxxxCH...CXXCH cytochrome family protein
MTKRFSYAVVSVLAVALFVCPFSIGFAGVVNSPHDFSQPTGLSTKSTVVSPGGACGACHVPHDALDNVLWPRNLGGLNNYRTLLNLDGTSNKPNYVAGATLQCYDCHDYHYSGGVGGSGVYNNPDLNLFQANHKPHNVAFGFQTKKRDSSIVPDTGNTMKEAAPAAQVTYPGFYENSPPYASNYGANAALAPRSSLVDLAKSGGHYFKSGDPNASAGVYRGDKLPCRDCHDPHKWSDSWQAFFGPRVQATNASQWSTVFGNVNLGSYTTPVGSEYMANPLQSGTATPRQDHSSRKLCIVCHGTSSDSITPGPVVAVTFTQINPTYSNPAPTIVRPPAGISEHQSVSTIACVSCHQHNSIDASCSMCHGFPPSDTATIRYPTNFTPAPDATGVNDSHARHVGNKQGAAKNSSGPYSIACAVCHYGSAMGTNAALNHHQNNLVSVVLNGAYTKAGGSYDNTNYFNQRKSGGPTGQLDNTNAFTGWGNLTAYGGNSCKNVYCHSAGRDVSSMTADNLADFPRPVWFSGARLCNGCHGYGNTDNVNNPGMPSYPNGGPGLMANSHGSHVLRAGIECTTCHFDTVTGAGATRAIKGVTSTKHVNLLRDVVFDVAVVPAGSYDNVNKRCSVNCHGSGTPVWGQTNLSCFSCHSGTEANGKPQPNQGIPSPVDNTQYLSSGHGRPLASGVYPGDSNPPAHFDNAAGRPSDCYVCHSQASRHIGRTSSDITYDPYRLGSVSTGTTGGLGVNGSGGFTGTFADNVDLLCLGCHGSAAQRSGHDNAATGTRTVDAVTHATGIAGTKYTWPVSPFKCVDCHDPHGDSNWKMVRASINAPRNSTDTLAGSNSRGTPLRSSGLDNIVFTSLIGQAAGSYASLPTTGRGICEICHNQTAVTYLRNGTGAMNGHPTTTRCSQCHTHPAGFKGASCKGCHGGEDSTGMVINNAPNMTKFWLTSGHGRYSTQAPLPVNTVQCEDCHDIGYLSGADHKTNGTAGLTYPPTNTNTLTWPGKTGTADTNPTTNTSHLKSSFFPSSPTRKYDFARSVDLKCGTVGTGCHPNNPYSHVGKMHPSAASLPFDNVLIFGRAHGSTPPNPKLYPWYPVVSSAPDYVNRFFESPAVWVISDLTTLADNASFADRTTVYGGCVSCHDPHGTSVPINLIGASTNKMLRGDAGTGSQSFFCNTVCHGN